MQLNPHNNDFFFWPNVTIAQNTYCTRNKGHRGAQQTTFMRGIKSGIKEILAETGCQLRQMRMMMRHCLSVMTGYYEIGAL